MKSPRGRLTQSRGWGCPSRSARPPPARPRLRPSGRGPGPPSPRAGKRTPPRPGSPGVPSGPSPRGPGRAGAPGSHSGTHLPGPRPLPKAPSSGLAGTAPRMAWALAPPRRPKFGDLGPTSPGAREKSAEAARGGGYRSTAAAPGPHPRPDVLLQKEKRSLSGAAEGPAALTDSASRRRPLREQRKARAGSRARSPGTAGPGREPPAGSGSGSGSGSGGHMAAAVARPGLGLEPLFSRPEGSGNPGCAEGG